MVEINFFHIRQYEISCNISTDHISENGQNKIYNFEIRHEKFTDQTKKAKKYWLVGIELSYMTMLKASKHRYCLSFYLCQKYVA